MKKLMKKYGHVWILSYGLIYLPWFTALQQNVGKPYHVMHTALDDLIPFNEYFIVPYLLWFLYVAAAIAYFFLYQQGRLLPAVYLFIYRHDHQPSGVYPVPQWNGFPPCHRPG